MINEPLAESKVDQKHMTSRTRWAFVTTAAIVLVAAGMVLPAMKRSNCGGNSAALAACKGYVTVLQLWAVDHDGQRFQIGQADKQTRSELESLPGAAWIRSARLMARVNDVRVDVAAERRIIMVCDHAYDNVPHRILGKSPMAHAVAYSTGETGLISPEEYARLDLSGFVDLQTLAGRTKVN
jgi:hypothetical protein